MFYKSIHLIDDDIDDRFFFKEAVAAIDDTVEVCTYPDCQDFITLSSQCERPLIVFLDIQLPKSTGLNCLNLLKSDPELNDIPIVIYSANSNPRYSQSAYDAGAVKFLKKQPKISLLIQQLTVIFAEDYNNSSKGPISNFII